MLLSRGSRDIMVHDSIDIYLFGINFNFAFLSLVECLFQASNEHRIVQATYASRKKVICPMSNITEATSVIISLSVLITERRG
jgi:hypothetical protein